MSWRRAASWTGWLTVLVALAGLTPAPARGDGDPASDTLIAQSVFYPYSTSVPAADRRALDSAVAAAARAGGAIKVALIAHPSDLGSITALYGKPERYARFLHTEISYAHSVRLLVVMPSGDGLAGVPARLARTAGSLPRAGGPSGASLATAATRAIRTLTADTHRGGGAATSASDSGAGRTVLLLALILAAILVTGTIVILRVFFPPPPRTAGGQTRSARAGGRRGRPRARSRRRE